jgi:hypothetical protein
MMNETCSYELIQTPPEVWAEILLKCPIHIYDKFFEPFKGTGNLYNQVDCDKEWCEITEDRNIFEYDLSSSDRTVIYTNPPFKTNISNKYKNCVYYFLELFMRTMPTIHTVGFLMNANSFLSISPKRMKHLNDLGFFIDTMISLRVQCWYGLYFFVLFKRQTNKSFLSIEKYFN